MTAVHNVHDRHAATCVDEVVGDEAVRHSTLHRPFHSAITNTRQNTVDPDVGDWLLVDTGPMVALTVTSSVVGAHVMDNLTGADISTVPVQAGAPAFSATTSNAYSMLPGLNLDPPLWIT